APAAAPAAAAPAAAAPAAAAPAASFAPLPAPPAPRPPRRIALFLAAAALACTRDLVTKHWGFAALGGEGVHRDLLPGWFAFSTTKNTGVVWGMFQDQNRVFTALASLAVPILAILFFSLRHPSLPSALGLGLILGGTSGNLYDRIHFTGVRDFLDVYIIRWPVFNVADACICVGAILFALEVLFRDPDGEPPGRRS
ncbi:MAG: signal peptidase II, partial [Planctomycetes bacterium]|nr:signal peptidase II [Planctomycetota bacterium]